MNLNFVFIKVLSQVLQIEKKTHGILIALDTFKKFGTYCWLPCKLQSWMNVFFF